MTNLLREAMSPRSTAASKIWIWIFCLAALSVGARNFEEGLSLDAPIYSTIARNMVRTGEWFRMDCQLPDFVPFAEHPHLGFWTMAAWLKWLPAEDWAIRIPGHIFYLLFLGFLFFYIRRRGGETVATWTVVLLWSMHLFSNVFSTFYLDPGVLLLGTLSLWAWERSLQQRAGWAIAGGALMGAAVMYKGLTVLGFVPVAAWLLLVALWDRRPWWELLAATAFYLGSLFLVVGLYLWSLKRSTVPGFIDLYLARQVTHRFARRWSLAGLFSWEYWRQMLNYTNYLLPLALVGLKGISQKRYLLFPLIFALSFIFMFSTSGLQGGQYLIMILPWTAWLIAEAMARLVPVRAENLRRVTLGISLLAVFFLQYLPISTHGRGSLPEYRLIRRLAEAGTLKVMYLELPEFPSPFVLSGPFAWYGDVRVLYAPSALAETPKPAEAYGYFLRFGYPEREKRLSEAGWCRQARVDDGSLWLECRTAVGE